MKKANKWLALLLAIIMIASIGLAGCGNDDATEDPKPPSGDADKPKAEEPKADGIDAEQVLNYNLGAEPAMLDNTLTTYLHEFEVMNQIYEGLIREDKDQKVIPGLAESWEISPDKQTFTFKLRDAKWSNGDPITADDFEFAWKLAMNPKTGSTYGFLFGVVNIVGAADFNAMSVDSSDADLQAAADKVGVNALDAKTLEVKLGSPSNIFLPMLAFATFFPINEKFFNSLEAGTFGTDVDKMLYSGPFVLSDWTHDQSIQLKKNSDYWEADVVKIEEINYAMITDSNTSFNLYQAGDLDSVGIPDQFLEQYKGDANASYEPAIGSFFLYHNQEGEGVKGDYLRNQNFMHAMSFSLDRQKIVDVIYGGVRKPAYGVIPPGIFGNTPGQNFRDEYSDIDKIITEDVNKAKELLAKAQEEVGQPLPTFEFLTGDSDISLKLGQIMQEMWKQIGVEITINQQPSKIARELANTRKYDIWLSNWYGDYNDPSTYMDLWQTGNSFNRLSFSDARYDELVKGAATEPDQKKRMDAYAEAERILVSHGGVVPIMYAGSYVLRQPYVKDVVRYPTGAVISFKWAYVQGK